MVRSLLAAVVLQDLRREAPAKLVVDAEPQARFRPLRFRPLLLRLAGATPGRIT